MSLIALYRFDGNYTDRIGSFDLSNPEDLGDPTKNRVKALNGWSYYVSQSGGSTGYFYYSDTANYGILSPNPTFTISTTGTVNNIGATNRFFRFSGASYIELKSVSSGISVTYNGLIALSVPQASTGLTSGDIHNTTVVVNKPAGYIKIIIDGQLVGTSDDISGTENNTTSGYLYLYGATGSFTQTNGNLYDCRLYDTALSDTEAQDISKGLYAKYKSYRMLTNV